MSPPVEQWQDGDVSHTRQVWTRRDVMTEVTEVARRTIKVWQLGAVTAVLALVVAVLP